MPELVRTVGRYGILRELGRGGMAVVHLARQLDLDRLVALKELAAFRAADPAFARRFVRESRLAGSLVHPNVITVFDYFEHDGTPYIAMEYVQRGSLRPYVGRMTLAQIGGVLEGLLAGLAAAEQLAIVHRDLKPENVMVTSSGGVKIADFGIAKATQAADTGAFVTTTGTTVGTPQYMAPEQAMARDIGPWTDLYSVGCMAYELFTGTPPFHGTQEPMAILLKHVTEALPPACEVADVDREISDWIERLTAKEPAKRPGAATTASRELEGILIDRLGPRWRWEATLPEPPGPRAEAPSPATPVPGPATPPPSAPGPPIEGIDLEGTGPDTPEPIPSAATPEDHRTYVASPATLPPADAGVRTTGAVAEPPVPHRVILLSRIGAVALLAALVIPLLATGPDRWNVFAVLSPFEAGGAAVAIGVVARALAARRVRLEVAAGVLAGLGGLMTVASLALLKFTSERLDAASVAFTIVVLLGAGATLAAGVGCLRSSSPGEATTAADPAPLVLGLAGVALASVAMFVNYDGFSSLWVELQEGESAEFFVEPAVGAAAMLAGLLLLGARPGLACGLLLALGAATAAHFLGLIVAAWRAIGEVGEVRSAGFVGVAGGLLVLAAGALAYRAWRRSHPRPAGSGHG